MTTQCDEIVEHAESIAAGEVTPEAKVAAHVSSCAECAAVLEEARRIERLLLGRRVPDLPAAFTARTLARVGRERWRREQVVDAAFNIALGVTALAVVGVVWLFVRQTGLTVVGNVVMTQFGGSLPGLAKAVAPSLPPYVGAAALIATALGVWWWAESY